MNKKQAYHPTLLLFGSFCFLLLGFLAIFFYLERTTMVDAAYQVFNVILKEKLAIQVNRFGAAFTQSFPLLAVKLSLPLKQVLLSYSLAFILYPVILFGLIKKLTGHIGWALTLPLFYVLMVGHTFYWIQSELIQGGAFLLFFFAVVHKKDILNLKTIPFFYFGLVLIIFFHPLLFIPFFYLWFFSLHSELKQNQWYWSLPPMSIIILVIKHLALPSNSYDSVAISQSQNLFENWWNFFSFLSTKRFLTACLKEYYFFTILFLALIYTYTKLRQYSKILLLVGFSLAYIFLVNSTFRWGLPLFHMESFNQVLAIFVLVPFILDLLPRFSLKHQLLLIGFIIAIRLIHITTHHSSYTNRLEWNKELIQDSRQAEGQKFLLSEKEAPIELLQISWASPYETILLSSIAHPDSSQSIFIYNPELHPVDNWLPAKESLITPFGPIPLEMLPTDYFSLKPDSEYILLPQK